MTTGTISYYALLNGLELDEIELSNAHPKIDKIKIKTENSDRISIIITLSGVYSSKEAGSIGSEIVNIILDRLSIEFDIPIEEPHCSGMSLPIDESGKKHIVTGSFVALNDIIAGDIKPGQERIKDLIQELEAETPPRNHHLSLYRFSAKQKDPLARFMFLYNILLQLNGDSQKDVDAFIKTCDSGAPQSPRPDKPKIIETIYTRLRNEIAHRRDTVLPEDTAKEIMDNVAAFQSIVKTAILNSV